MDIDRGVDENQCDIKILEIVVRFVILADSTVIDYVLLCIGTYFEFRSNEFENFVELSFVVIRAGQSAVNERKLLKINGTFR